MGHWMNGRSTKQFYWLKPHGAFPSVFTFLFLYVLIQFFRYAASDLNVQGSALSACVLKDLPNIIDYAYPEF